MILSLAIAPLILGIPYYEGAQRAQTHGSEAEEVRHGPGHSPVSWLTLTHAPPLKIDLLRQFVCTHAGVPTWDGSPQFIAFYDREPFGDGVGGVHAWLVTVPSVVVARRLYDGRGDRDTTRVELNMVVSRDGSHLIAAFTTAKAVWVIPRNDVGGSDAQPRLEEFCGSPAPTETAALRSSIAEILGAAWSLNGRSPADAGQVIVRPRDMHCRNAPPRNPGERGTLCWWVVQELGVVARRSEVDPREYATGTIHTIHDENAEYTFGFPVH